MAMVTWVYLIPIDNKTVDNKSFGKPYQKIYYLD